MRCAVVALACTVLSFGSVAAQTPGPTDDVEAHVLEELVVRARLPGPAWWRVSDDDTTVYVLGLPDALPKGMAWDRTILERRLARADRLITPPVRQATASIFALPILLLQVRGAARAGAAERGATTADARLAAAALVAGRSEADYTALRPWFAGMMLARDYRRRVGLDYGEPLKDVRTAARRAKVPVEPAVVVKSKASALLEEVKSTSPAAGRTCLDAAMQEVEAGDDSVRRSAAAWASGDVRVALAARRSTDVCWAALPGAATEKLGSLEAVAAALESALIRPGHAVAALPLRTLLAKGGVLERLRAKGFKVETPGGDPG